MRVAFVSHSPHLTGGEKMMLNLATALASAGRAECLVVVSGEGPMLAAELPPGCRFLRLANPMPWYVLLGPGRDAPAAHLRAVGPGVAEAAAGLRGWGAEVVVVNTLTNLTGVLAAARLNVPTVAWVHGIIDHLTHPHAAAGLKAACDEAILRAADAVACPSEWTAAYFRSLYARAVEVIPNATAVPDHLPPPPAAGGPTVFCCLNTWDLNKGMATLLDAAALLRLHTDRFRLDLYGDGSPVVKETIRSRIAGLGLGGVVRVCGRTTDTAAVYRASHALVTASEIESFGMTLIEAMSHARPVIVADTSGHREIVDGPHGVKCPPGDPAAFAWHMLRVVEDPGWARGVGEAGWRVARERYGYDRLADRFGELFRRVIAAERGRPPAAVAHRYAPCRALLALAS